MQSIKRHFLLLALALLSYGPASFAVMTSPSAESATTVASPSVQWSSTSADGSSLAAYGPHIALAQLEQATLFPPPEQTAPRPAVARTRTTEAAASSTSEGPRPISAVLATIALVLFFFVRRLT